MRKRRVGFPKELYLAKGRHERGTSDYRTRDGQRSTQMLTRPSIVGLRMDRSMFPLHHSCTTTTSHGRGGLGSRHPQELLNRLKTFRAYRRIIYYGIDLCIHNACLMEKLAGMLRVYQVGAREAYYDSGASWQRSLLLPFGPCPRPHTWEDPC